VGVEKVTSIRGMRISRSMLEGSIRHALLIPIVGGLLIMMGQHDRSETLFYYFRLEDQVPENHLLRLEPRNRAQTKMARSNRNWISFGSLHRS